LLIAFDDDENQEQMQLVDQRSLDGLPAQVCANRPIRGIGPRGAARVTGGVDRLQEVLRTPSGRGSGSQVLQHG
jgi:hypothetical protein